MTELISVNRSFVKISLYRFITSIFTMIGFVFFQSIAIEILESPNYAYWIGLIGAIAVLSAIRITFGTFKTIENPPIELPEFIWTNPNIGKEFNAFMNAKPTNLVPQNNNTFQPFNPIKSDFQSIISSRPDDMFSVSSLKSQSKTLNSQISDEESIERVLLNKINLVQIKQQKLEGMRNVINPRVYDVLKRQYEMEKKFLLDDFSNEQKASTVQNSIPNPLSKFPSATNPEIITEFKELNEDKLLERFKTLDKLLTNRLETMKSQNMPSISENTKKKNDKVLESFVQN